MLLTIKHTTIYRYGTPVVLLPHRLMLTPRSSHHLTLRSIRVSTSPPAEIEWSQDVFGNLIATAVFSEASDELIISGDMVVDQGAPAWPVFRVAPHAHNYPFGYSEAERSALGKLLVPEYEDETAGRALGQKHRCGRVDRHAVAAAGSQQRSPQLGGIRQTGQRRDAATH